MSKRVLLGNIAAAVALTLVLAIVGGIRGIPISATAYHWGRAWLGFDCAMCTILAALAFCAIRRHGATGPVAAVESAMLLIDAWFDVRRSRWAVPCGAASGTLLLIDAWFDVCTSPSGIELRMAVVDAFLEVSMALLCLLPAFRMAAKAPAPHPASAPHPVPAPAGVPARGQR